MANKRYNMVVPIPTKDGTYWHKIGAGWFDEGKKQISLSFNSLPIPVETNGKWETRAFLFEATDERPNQQRAPAQQREDRAWSEELDDEIPF